MTENILVKVVCNDDFVMIRTFSRSHGRLGRLFLRSDIVWDALWTDTIHYDSDCGHFAEFRRIGDTVSFDVFWLSYYGCDNVEGFVQRFKLPFVDLAQMIQEGGDRKYLCKPPTRTAKIDVSRATRTLKSVLDDSLTKRAFSKAVRDCFRWPGETVYLASDGKTDFYFTTESGFPKNGGLILHEINSVLYPGIYYSVHT